MDTDPRGGEGGTIDFNLHITYTHSSGIAQTKYARSHFLAISCHIKLPLPGLFILSYVCGYGNYYIERITPPPHQMKYCVYKNHNLSGNFFIHSIPFVQKVKNVVDIVFYKLKVMLDFIFAVAVLFM